MIAFAGVVRYVIPPMDPRIDENRWDTTFAIANLIV
jgi:hypothetical protein